MRNREAPMTPRLYLPSGSSSISSSCASVPTSYGTAVAPTSTPSRIATTPNVVEAARQSRIIAR